MAIIKAAVRQYGLSFGPQSPDQVTTTMGEIIRKFPDTPMAAVAGEHIKRAQQLIEKGETKLAATNSPITRPTRPLARHVATSSPRSVRILFPILGCTLVLIVAVIVVQRSKKRGMNR